MSFTITEAFVSQFHGNIELKFQQMGSVLRPYVTINTQQSKTDYYDRLLPTTALSVTTRHGDSPLVQQTHERRAITMKDKEWGDLIDSIDQVRMLADPTNAYVENAAMALGRAWDDEVIAAATRDAITGELGTGTASFNTSTNQVAVNYVDPGASVANTNLTISKLRKTRSILGKAEVLRKLAPGQKPIFVLAQAEIDALLRATEFTNNQWADVKALVEGDASTFMGFNFVRTESLLLSTNTRTCLAFPAFAIQVGEGAALDVRVSERADKRYAKYVYAKSTFGASRMWEEAVVAVLCDETAGIV